LTILEGRRLVLPITLIVLVLAATGSILLRNARAVGPGNQLTASGIIEAQEVVLAAETMGRITAIAVREGDSVAVGDAVARLDDALIQLQIVQAVDPATRRQLELQAERYVVRSPIGGVVTRLPAHVGEVASPGQPIATVVDLTHLDVTVYVLERDLGRVGLRQAASVAADPFPGQSFTATVTSINPTAEFTPRNIQTQRDRQNLVFGVKLRVTDSAGLLKPGMPVDVTFASGS
jgi:HlyD family secretion protein